MIWMIFSSYSRPKFQIRKAYKIGQGLPVCTFQDLMMKTVDAIDSQLILDLGYVTFHRQNLEQLDFKSIVLFYQNGVNLLWLEDMCGLSSLILLLFFLPVLPY